MAMEIKLENKIEWQKSKIWKMGFKPEIRT